jgi:hypothetical protein
MAEKIREIITVLGKQGQGKSHAVKQWLIPLFKKKPVIIADSMAEYSGKKYTFAAFYAYILKYKKYPKYAAVQLRSADEARKLFAIVNAAETPCTLIIEEADKYCSPHHIDRHLSALIDYGRHIQVDLIFIARRAASLHKNVTSQTDFFISFAQTEEVDIQRVKNFTDHFARIKRLERREFFVFGSIPSFSQISISENQVFTITNNKPLQINEKS